MRLEEKYDLMNNEEKASFIREMELNCEEVTLKFLCGISDNQDEYDLVRIESIKALGLMATECAVEIQTHIAEHLIRLAKTDPDDDIRTFSLQSLALLHWLDFIPGRVKEIVLDQNEYVLVREAAYAVVVSQRGHEASQKILTCLLKDDIFKASADRALCGMGMDRHEK